MGELIEKLGIDWKLLLANTLTFFMVLWILRKFAYRPIMEVLEKRQREIGQGLDAAKRSHDELAAMQQQKAEVLKAAKTEALAIVNEAKLQGEKARQQIVDEAQAEATATVTRTRTQLEHQRKEMVNDAKRELADLVVAATGKVLDGALDTAAEAKLSARAVAALKEANR